MPRTAWRGMPWRGEARQREAVCQYGSGSGKAWHGMAWHGMARLCQYGSGSAMAWHGMAWYVSMARRREAVCHVMAWHRMALAAGIRYGHVIQQVLTLQRHHSLSFSLFLFDGIYVCMLLIARMASNNLHA